MLRGLSLFVAVYFVHACTTNDDCWMNGDCVEGRCRCDAGWKGPDCMTLDLVPLESRVGSYGYAPNISSWGGKPIEFNGAWHMQVSEMINGCGLSVWRTNSRVIHAVSNSITGPYRKVNVSLPYWAHTPQVAVDYSKGSPVFIMLHVGSGRPNGFPKECGKNDADTTHPRNTNGLMHSAPSPYGPWTPVNDANLPDLNNPAPFIFPNGTAIFVTNNEDPWPIYRGDSYKGPWTKIKTNWKTHTENKFWEDPFIWWDAKRQVWKMVAHTLWDTRQTHCLTDYSKYVSGYGWSRDLKTWHQNTEVEPWSALVEYADGTSVQYNTRERPQMIFDKEGKMIALSTGIGGVPMPGGCKETLGIDWSFTLVQKINTQ